MGLVITHGSERERTWNNGDTAWAQACLGAVRLLQLRAASRQQPDVPARHCVAPELIITVQSYLKLLSYELTLRDFWRAVAQLGGFLGRTRDGDPGWQVLWRGWLKLQDLAWQPTA